MGERTPEDVALQRALLQKTNRESARLFCTLPHDERLEVLAELAPLSSKQTRCEEFDRIMERYREHV